VKLETVRQILDGQVLTGKENLEVEVGVGCGADLMSDVLAYVKPNALLLTGLTNVQSVRTADIAGVRAIVYVRGKRPDKEAIELAEKTGIVLLATSLLMYEACGKLYAHGLRGGSETEEGSNHVPGAHLLSTL
jgi:predicted transcriptional regulator